MTSGKVNVLSVDMQSLLCSVILLCIHIMWYGTITRCSGSQRDTRDASESSKLYALDLSHNDLSFLCSRTFLQLNIVEIVNLSLAENVIRCIAQHAFLGLEELERLDLSRNNLTYIHQDTFKHNRKLYWLSFAGNKLFTLPSEGVFINVLSLRFLDLSSCSVTDISYSIFKDIMNIKYLNISHNQIRNIKQETFELLRELRCLDISFNSLSSLHSDSYFSNMNICDYLPSDSSESCLTTDVPSSVLKLKADNNPWNCDCDMKDLFDIIFKSVLTLPNLTCIGPLQYENKHWEVLKDADCSTTVAPTVIRTTKESVSFSITSSLGGNSPIPEDTEKPAINNDGPHTATLITMLQATVILLVIIVGLIISFIIFILFVVCRRRLKRNFVPIPPETNTHEAVPLQALSGPEGSRQLRFPDFMTTAQAGGKNTYEQVEMIEKGTSN